MATVSVSFNGTRVNDSDAATNTGNWGSSGPAPASEFPLAYQVTSGTTTGAVNKKINSTSLGGLDFDPVTGTPVDMTAAANRLWFVKTYVSDSFDLNTTEGVRIGVGSGNAAYYYYNVAGSGANNTRFSTYPAQGGYLIFGLDPNIAQWREGNVGSPVLTAVDWVGVQCAFVNGTAKAENLALDSIDIGTGLVLTGGDGVDTDGTFLSFVTTDQGTKANRWGVVTGSGNAVKVNGLLEIGRNTGGTATATGFTDTTSIVTFPDGYHSRGLVGVDVDLGSASTVVTIDSLMIGEGALNGADADDTRPDFTVNGTAGTLAVAAQMRNFRDVTFTSACTVDGADIECVLLTQASCDIENCVIRTNQVTQVATLQDPTFGVSTDLNNTEFVQSGVGHAIEIDTPGTYNLQDITFTGYGGTPGTNSTPSSGANDAAVYNSSGGAVTINVNGTGNQPSVRNAASSTTTVNQTVTVTIKAVDTAGDPIQGAKVFLETGPGGTASINHVGTTSVDAGASATGVTLSEPSGTQEDDLILVIVKNDATGSNWTAPADFTQIDEATGTSNQRFWLGYKVRGATTGSGYSFTHDFGAGTHTAGQLVVYRDENTSTPLDVSYVQANHKTDSVDDLSYAPSAITTATNNSWVVIMSGYSGGPGTVSWATVSGYTVDGVLAVSDGRNLNTIHKLVATAGTETPGSFGTTGDTGEDGTSFTLAIRPGTTSTGGDDLISYALTDSLGETSISYGGSTPQAVRGYVRKGSVSPVYKASPISASITSSGLNQTVVLVADE
jgi:hypothetical protein